MKRDRIRVLLLWPGGLLSGGGNFGVPQLLTLAQSLTRAVDADVDVVDLDCERGLADPVHPERVGVDMAALLKGGYDLVGVSCYSSFDYLKVLALGGIIRKELPRAWLVVGGYHPSARPDDFTREDSPFDFTIIGDGELPLVRLAELLLRGNRPLNRVLGPESVPHPGDLMPYPWEKLGRYRPIARSLASQAEIYLSRGCPFDCAFCMERAKRDVSWRALEPEAAVEELHRLDQFLDLQRWTLFIADALFGMKLSWRRAFLEGLARRPISAQKIWLLIRVDLVEREDLELMARANVGPGFGLESGDPEQLKLIRKAGKLESYLEKMLQVAGWARELNVAFGANIIVGHPGETEARMRTSAAYMRKLFLEHPAGTHGFLSVDPFRLYPGSPIDEERETWQRETGMRVHRYPWWEDGDQEFLSEWVDPSRELSYRRSAELSAELFDPILRQIKPRFAYAGPARNYFMRAIDEQIRQTSQSAQLHRLGLWHLWSGLTGSKSPGASALAEDTELAQVARGARAETLARLSQQLDLQPRVLAALDRVPRERFVPVDLIARSAEDAALRLDDSGQSTISALHAYALSLQALELQPGDRVADLGGGTGYGAALAAELVGPDGAVFSLEFDSHHAARARELLKPWPQASAETGDAHEVSRWLGANKVVVAFALRQLPTAFLDALPVGGKLVAPVHRTTARGAPDVGAAQELVCFTRTSEGYERQVIEHVLYVPDRSPTPAS